MNKSGIGLGSASVLLVFVVLCLAIFTVISFITARNDKVLALIEAEMVINYYHADMQAELILAKLLRYGLDISEVGDVEVIWEWNMELMAETAEFAYPINEDRELYVRIAFHGDSFDILNWQTRDTVPWELELYFPALWAGWRD